MTAALKASIKHKNLLYKTYLKHPSDKNRDEYNNCKDILRGVLKQAEIKYYENLFDEHKYSVYNMWKSLNPIINPKKGKSATVIKKLIIDRKVILEKQNISDDMNEHFCNVGEKLQAEIPDYGLKYMEYMPPRTANKKGVEHDSYNYRPISLLSHFDKIFEKILCRRLISFLERNELLYCYQYGFRKSCSTGLALIEITDYIKRLLDEKKYVISIFIDFKKTFDTVDHEILLHKLEYYGIRGIANNFLRSYLTNRRQYTVINGIKSDLRTVSCGVPQGSVLGPWFFLLYINDLYNGIGCNAARLYADDTALITSNHNLNLVQDQGKELFMKLYHWCIANKLSINSDKTNLVLFHLKNKPVPRDFTGLQTQAMKIDRVQSVQYLGMLLEEKLYWHEHVTQIYASLIKYFGIFNHIKNFVSVKIARQLFLHLCFRESNME